MKNDSTTTLTAKTLFGRVFFLLHDTSDNSPLVQNAADIQATRESYSGVYRQARPWAGKSRFKEEEGKTQEYGAKDHEKCSPSPGRDDVLRTK